MIILDIDYTVMYNYIHTLTYSYRYLGAVDSYYVCISLKEVVAVDRMGGTDCDCCLVSTALVSEGGHLVSVQLPLSIAGNR